MPIIAYHENDEDDEDSVVPLTAAEEIKDTADNLRTHIEYFIINPNYRDMAIIVRIMERYEEQYTTHHEIRDEFAINKINIELKKKLDDLFYKLDQLLRSKINWSELEEYDRWN